MTASEPTEAGASTSPDWSGFAPVQVATLQTVLGLFSIVIGAMMLIVPHQFTSVALFDLRGQMPLWGLGFLVAGSALLCVAIVRPHMLVSTALHCFAGFLFLNFAAGFFSVSSFTGAGAYGILGVGLIVSSRWLGRPVVAGSRDLFQLSMAGVALVLAIPMLIAPQQFTNPSYDPIRSDLRAWGLGFGVIGLFSVVAWAVWARHFAAQVISCTSLGLAFLAFAGVVSVPSRVFTGLALYGGSGAALVLLPWIRPHLRAINPRSLRVRLSLSLAAAASVPLIVLAALVAQTGSRSTVQQGLTTQRLIATSLANNVATFVHLHELALGDAGALLSVPTLPPGEAAESLKRVGARYPNLSALTIYGLDGSTIVGPDTRPPQNAFDQPYFADALQANGPVAATVIGGTSQQPMVIIAEAIRDANGRPTGVIAAQLSTRALPDFVAAANAPQRAYLIDGEGRALADTAVPATQSLEDVSQRDAVSASLGSATATGSLEVGRGASAQIAGFARVPGLTWAVVSEMPVSALTAQQNANFEALMGLVVVAIAMAAIAGLVMADRLARSLDTLSSAAEALADGSSHAPLPSSSLVEVDRLTTVFGIMRQRLDRRTAQREAAESEVRALNADLEGRVETRTAELHSALDTLRAEVAEREAAENAIDRLRHTTDLILNSAGDGVLGLDVAGRTTFANPAAAAMLGYSIDALLGTPTHELIHHHTFDGQRLEWENCPTFAALHTGQAQTGTTQTYWRRDDTPFEVEATTVPLVERGEITGAVITFRDVTERRAVDRMKNEFISVVSHELRTPLTAIRGSLGLLAGGMLGAMAPGAQRLVDIAASNTDRLVRLINDILDIERMESGRVSLNKRECRADELVHGVIDVMRTMAEEEGLQLSASVEPVRLTADPDRIQQVLTNLLSNAIKFSPYGSAILIDARANANNVIFRITDQGRGIPADKLEHIFARFQQVDASDSRDKGGTGLGLAICRSIVHQHNGEIWAESAGENQGSTFVVSLPVGSELKPDVFPSGAAPNTVGDAVETRRELDGRESRSTSKPKVLVVEDDRDLAAMLMAVFGQLGVQPTLAYTGREAVELASQIVPDTIVLDVGLPSGDGYAVVDALRRHDRLRSVPLVVYTACDLSPTDKSHLQLGPTRFITKGRMSPDEFEREMATLLRQAVASL